MSKMWSPKVNKAKKGPWEPRYMITSRQMLGTQSLYSLMEPDIIYVLRVF